MFTSHATSTEKHYYNLARLGEIPVYCLDCGAYIGIIKDFTTGQLQGREYKCGKCLLFKKNKYETRRLLF